MANLISFDIDGTMEFGDPPGTVTVEMVRCAQALGWIIGSCSDRPVPVQKALWQRHGIEVNFTVVKAMLVQVRNKFAADEYFHIGDTDVDRRYALDAGFTFLAVETSLDTPWMMTSSTEMSTPYGEVDKEDAR